MNGKIAMLPDMPMFDRPRLSPLIGANVDGKPNYFTHGWRGFLRERSPHLVAVVVSKFHYTHRGMTQNMTFSVNVPTVGMEKEVDYCGSVSGAKVPNKAEVCKFKVWYGKLGTAPMIEQCPINLECSVVNILDLGGSSLFIGRIEEGYYSENCFTDGKPDHNKVRPLYYSIVQRKGRKGMAHLYLSIGLHPDDPENLADIVASTVVEHVYTGVLAADAPQIDTYGRPLH